MSLPWQGRHALQNLTALLYSTSCPRPFTPGRVPAPHDRTNSYSWSLASVRRRICSSSSARRRRSPATSTAKILCAPPPLVSIAATTPVSTCCYRCWKEKSSEDHDPFLSFLVGYRYVRARLPQSPLPNGSASVSKTLTPWRLIRRYWQRQSTKPSWEPSCTDVRVPNYSLVHTSVLSRGHGERFLFSRAAGAVQSFSHVRVSFIN